MRNSVCTVIAGFLAAFGSAVPITTQAEVIGPSHYLCFDDSAIAGCNANDSPLAGEAYVYFHLEDFTDAQLNTPGVTVSTGAPPQDGPAVHPGGANEDSVDEDDGTIDGFGLTGGSFFVQPGSVGIIFTFDAGALGGLPTDVGVVWTDGGGQTSFEAFGPGGSLGTIGPVAIADGSFAGTTGEDHFFGVSDDGGVSSIIISSSTFSMQIDHLQYGLRSPHFSCEGFDSPMEVPVTIKKNRALPLKARLFDELDILATDVDVVSHPVVQVLFNPSVGGDPIDVTDDALPSGQSSDGNIFSFDASTDRWKYNLKTKNYDAPGTYTISMVSGDNSEYVVDPTCEAIFVVE